MTIDSDKLDALLRSMFAALPRDQADATARRVRAFCARAEGGPIE